MPNLAFVLISLVFIFPPLLFSPFSSELFEFPKIIVIYLVAGLLLPNIIKKLLEIRNQKYDIRNTNLISYLVSRISSYFVFIALFLFLLSQILSTIFSIDRFTSIWGYYSRFNGGLVSTFSYIIIGLAIFLFITPKQANKLLVINYLVGLLVAFLGFFSKFGVDGLCLLASGNLRGCWGTGFNPSERIFSTLGQPNWLAAYLLVIIFINLFFITTGYKLIPNFSEQFNKYLLILSLILFSVCILFTGSRSAEIAYIILVPIYFLINSINQKAKVPTSIFINKQRLTLPNQKRVTAFDAVTILYLLFSIFLYLFLNSSLLANLLTTNNQQLITKRFLSQSVTSSAEIRKIVWSGAIELGKKYPFFGTGVETFAYSYNFVRPTVHNLTSEWDYVYNKAHNELLNYFATTGYFGLFTYLLMWTSFVFIVWQKLNEIRYTKYDIRDANLISYLLSLISFYLCAMLSIFITNFFGFSTTTISLFTFTLPFLFLKLSDSYFSVDYSGGDAPSLGKGGHRGPPLHGRENPNFIFINKQRLTLPNKKSITTPQPRLTWFDAASILYSLFIFIYLLNYVTADHYYALGKDAKNNEDPVSSYQFFSKAISLRNDPAYLNEQSLAAANIAAGLKLQKQNKEAEKFAEQAQKINDSLIKQSPKNSTYWKSKYKINYLFYLSNLENKEKADKYFQETKVALQTAQNLNPTTVEFYFSQANLLLRKEPEKAKQLLNKVLELKPNYQPAKDLLKSF